VQISNAQATDCSICHPSTVAGDGTFVADGTHMDRPSGNNGSPTSPHAPDFMNPTVHGYAAYDGYNGTGGISSCTVCHSGYAFCTTCHTAVRFADWQTNCTFCHGTKTQGYADTDLIKAAPPEGVHGETATTDAKVGAHEKHMLGGGVGGLSDGIECGECHAVPSGLTHVDGTATVRFGTIATKDSPSASYSGGTCASTYCHALPLGGGARTTPSWTGSVGCGDCHTLQPMTGKHELHR
jgi:predicted CxxxxCH...CXXCH cytochrome family protein